MVQAIFNLVSHTFFTGLAIVGAGTLIHKAGSFIKKYETEKEDSYRKAFDELMINSVEEFNFCIDSLKKIVKSGTKGTLLLTDIISGNKVIQKDKNGKIIISDKSKLYNNYENTIDELNEKVKEYQIELEKIKKLKEEQKKKKITMKIKKKYEDDDDNDSSSIKSNFESIDKKIIGKKIKQEFTVESSDQEEQDNENKSSDDEDNQNSDEESDEEFIIQQKN